MRSPPPALASQPATPSAIEIEFWHAMGGDLGTALQALVDRFNAAQDEIVVNAVYKGGYEEILTDLTAALEQGQPAPHIAQSYDLATQRMLDSVRVIPVSRPMAAEGYNPALFIPAIRNYYSTHDGLAALPFNTSTPIVFINADLFATAGVQPPAQDWTLADLSALCTQLRTARPAQQCIGFGTVGWYFEQILANSGGLYFDQGNGHAGRAQSARFHEALGVEVFTALTTLIADGFASNDGPSWDAPANRFLNQEVALLMTSSSQVRWVLDSAAFAVQTTHIPHAASSERNGAVVGGGALWLIDTGSSEQQQAAWTFAKFLAEPQQQLDWHKATGYLPVRADLLEDEEAQAFWQNQPNFRTAVDQLVTTNAEDANGPNFAVSGGRAGAFPDIRPLIVAAYARVLHDGLTPAQALDEAQQAADAQIAGYQVVVTKPISPAAETSVMLPGDNLAFTFGAGVFAEDVDLRYESGALNPEVQGLQGVGVNFSVTAVASGSNEEVAPTQPYTLTASYRDVQIDGVDESTLAFYFWQDDTWVREDTSVVDAQNSQVTATPSHFSEWALLGRTPTLYLPVVTAQ